MIWALTEEGRTDGQPVCSTQVVVLIRTVGRRKPHVHQQAGRWASRQSFSPSAPLHAYLGTTEAEEKKNNPWTRGVGQFGEQKSTSRHSSYPSTTDPPRLTRPDCQPPFCVKAKINWDKKKL